MTKYNVVINIQDENGNIQSLDKIQCNNLLELVAQFNIAIMRIAQVEINELKDFYDRHKHLNNDYDFPF